MDEATLTQACWKENSECLSINPQHNRVGANTPSVKEQVR